MSNAKRAAAPYPTRTRTRTNSPDLSKLDEEGTLAFGSLSRLADDLDPDELSLILRRYKHADVALEAHRFAERVEAGDTTLSYPLKAFESWLDKARPKQTRATVPTGRLSEVEITTRLARYRRNIEGGEVYGEPYLAPEDVDELCADFERRLRR